MKIYISGPMTGIEKLNYPRFNKTEENLKRMGYEVFNPARIKGAAEWTWEDYMRECIRAIPDCTHIMLLNNWERSKGAQTEYYIAQSLGMKVMFEGSAIYGA